MPRPRLIASLPRRKPKSIRKSIGRKKPCAARLPTSPWRVPARSSNVKSTQRSTQTCSPTSRSSSRHILRWQNPITIARPYAEAVFALASAENALPVWAQMLKLAAEVASDAQDARRTGRSQPRGHRPRNRCFCRFAATRLIPKAETSSGCCCKRVALRFFRIFCNCTIA